MQTTNNNKERKLTTTMDDVALNQSTDRFVPASYWLGLGYSQEYANAMLALQLALFDATVQLSLLKSPIKDNETNISNKIDLHGTVNNLPEDILLHDDSLLPLWQQFGDEAASLAASSDNNIGDGLTISILDVEIPSKVMKILAVAFEKLPIKKLILENNRLCSDGLIGLTNLVRKNSSINRLGLGRNEIYNYELLSLAEAISERSYEIILLNQISRPIVLDQVVVPRLFNLKTLALTNSSLGSKSAFIISQHLSINPPINFLYLDGNLFNDDDAIMFAQSLQSNNTNLNLLDLCNNNFTNEGIKTLYRCVYNDESLNLMHDANTTCEMVLFDENKEAPDGIPNKLILSFNEKASNGMRDVFSKAVKIVTAPLAHENTILIASMILRLTIANINATPYDYDFIQELIRRGRARRLKILYALQDSNTGILNMHYLKEIPLQYIPNVLVFIQECGGWSQSEEMNLDRVYQVIKSRPGVLMSEFAAGGSGRKKSNTPRRGRRQSSHQCRCSIM